MLLDAVPDFRGRPLDLAKPLDARVGVLATGTAGTVLAVGLVELFWPAVGMAVTVTRTVTGGGHDPLAVGKKGLPLVGPAKPEE